MNGIWHEHFTKMSDAAFTAFVHLLAGEAADDARRRGLENLKQALNELSQLTARPGGDKQSEPDP